jgi:7-cyano-7-deazaguanine synthase
VGAHALKAEDPDPAGPPAIVLLSGGLDSATCLAVALDEGLVPVALSFRYGQRHDHEVDAARVLAERSGVEHVVCHIDLRLFGGSALTSDLPVPKDRDLDHADDIPVTYVPARNTIFLAYALALAEVREAQDIFIGVNAVDYSGYPDCRPEFVAAFEDLANLATRAGVVGTARIRIRTPLQDLGKADIIRLGTTLGVDYAATTSCYDPDEQGRACGRCDSCRLRAAGFEQAGVADPTAYVD